MKTNGSARVHYFDRQFLRPEDFSDEQAYHLAMHRRHNLAQHTWGIVSGLDLKAEEGTVFVQAGFAIDGYGRDLILSSRQRLPVEQFNQKRTDLLDVWILYGQSLSNVAPDGYSGCGTNASAQYREPEMPTLRLDLPDISYPNRRLPKGVPVTDYQFDATRLPPDDPNKIWPVFLGQITRTADPNSPYSVSAADRPYAGLVAESVVAPSQQTRLQIGQGVAQTDQPGFAVFVQGATSAAQNPTAPNLSIDNKNEITLRGDATVYGNVKIPSGALEFAVGPAAAPAVSLPDPAQPWKIYVGQTDQGQTELRIEMSSSGSGKSLVSIGTFSDDKKKFEACFSIDDQCNVTVEKDLSVGGRITDLSGNIPSVILDGLSQQVQQLQLGSLLSGIGGASSVLGQVFRPPAITPTMLAGILAASPHDLSAFVAVVNKQFPTLGSALKAQL